VQDAGHPAQGGYRAPGPPQIKTLEP